ncbi:uncharacterized protein LOC114352080, partial [Ostrinia furnacalis]|uniref:uncharacterized protein LOC114352080 n=1 Tax=Ostrinia furnacalis TaxID=93504 RepID=UPI00103F3EDE
SVCSPRPSREPDAFANSLRKYPNVSMERSTEMVERLITYTQAKNVSKSYQARYGSPSRHGTESNTSNQISPDRSTSRNTVPRTGSYRNTYEPEVNCRPKPRLEESPTRDVRADCDCAEYRRQVMRADSKYLKEVARKVKDNLRMSSYPYSQPVVGPVIRERCEQNYNFSQTPSLLTATNSVNMEVQAAAEMVSKEVATVPRTDPVKRTVAVPLSPASSSDDTKPEGDVLEHANLNPHPRTYKSVETASMPVDLSIQTTSSSVDVAKPVRNCRCFVIQRKTKSNENLRKGFGDEIFELLDKVSVCPNADPQASDLRREVLKQMSAKLQEMTENLDFNEGPHNKKDDISKLLKYVPVWVPCGDVQAYREAISDEIISRMNRYKSYDVYRTETNLQMSNDGRNLDGVIVNWIRSIPFQTVDIFGKVIDKGDITETLSNRIKRLIRNRSRSDNNSLKSEIIYIISKLPIAVDEYKKSEYINNITDQFIRRLRLQNILKHGDNATESESNHRKKKYVNRFKKYVQPTEEEIKQCVSEDLKYFLERTCSHTNSVPIQDVEIEIIDFLIDSIEALRSGRDSLVESELVMLLCQEIDNITWQDARQCSQKLLHLVKNIFTSDTTNQTCTKSSQNSRQSQSYVILQNATNSCPHYQSNNNETANFSIGAISKDDVDASLDLYMNQLTTQIDEWLASLQTLIPQAHDSGFRQVVVHDLAGDIIDRHKYLELNPSCRDSNEDELEHLKYQIFKWINKLAGEDNMDTIEHAPELMQRIQSIPVPMLTRPQQNVSGSIRCCPPSVTDFNTSAARAEAVNTSQPMSLNNTKNNYNQSQVNPEMGASCCSSTHLKPSTPSMKQLNEEYDAFLKNWVKEIPIPSCTAAEKANADKARMGIYNGVWKAITRLKFEPATFHNQFYYEDALDDELEELFNALPKSTELETKKHLLKVQLIERTTNTNELIKSTAAPASFRQQLVESVYNSLPRGTSNKQPHEELQIMKLVEDFILCANFKDLDKAKGNVYRKKLIQEAQTLVDNVKKMHGKDLQDIDTDLYVTNIFNALHKVPLPSEETVKDEADEIMLGAEVEQWFLDLPVLPNNDGNEQLQRKKLKDALVKKIREIENDVNIFDCTGERVLKHEISSFLEKVPMQQGESLNITFMADEFANRLKNRAKQLQSGNASRKSVAIMDSVGYYEFSQHMPHCSSFSESLRARPAVANQSSYMIRDGTRVPDQYGYNYFAERSLPPHVPLPSEEYFTLEDSQATPKPQPPQMQQLPQIQQPLPQPIHEHNQYSRIQSNKSEQWLTLQESTGPPVAPNVQCHESIRERSNFNPPIQSPERQQSPCCRSAAASPVRQNTVQGLNRSGQTPRPSNIGVEQFSPASQPVPIPNIPLGAQTPCCNRNQTPSGNTSRIVSPTRQRIPTPIQTSVPSPGVMVPNQLPQVSCRVPEQMPAHPVSPPRTAEQPQQPEGNTEASGQRGPGQISSYGEPQWFSTPQQVITQGSAPRPGRKKIRSSQRNRRNLERRRLDLEEDTEEGFESEVDEPCRCMDRMMRCRRPPVCFAYDDYEMDQCYPLPYGCPYFY